MLINDKTLLYLRGDKLEDISPNSMKITHENVSIKEEGVFGNGYEFTGTKDVKSFITCKDAIPEGEFSIDFNFKKPTTGNVISRFLEISKGDKDNRIALIMQENGKVVLWYTIKGSASEIAVGSFAKLDEYNHFEMNRDEEGVYRIFLNGKLISKSNMKIDITNYDLFFGASGIEAVINSYTGIMDEIRLQKESVNKDSFTPPQEPYTSLGILTDVEGDIINFELVNIESVDPFLRAEVVVNDEIKETYDSIGKKSYEVSHDECGLGLYSVFIKLYSTEDNVLVKRVDHFHESNGIDNTTILMLHGDSFEDSSSYENDVINNNTTIIDEGKFGSCYKFADKSDITADFILPKEYTIDFFCKMDKKSKTQRFLEVQSSKDNRFVLYMNNQNNLMFWTSDEKNYTINVNDCDAKKFHHIELSVDETNTYRVFVNGNLRLTVEKGYAVKDPKLIIGSSLYAADYGTGAEMDEIRVSNIVMHKEDFEVPTAQYSPIKLNILRSDINSLLFTIKSSFDDLYINSIDLLINDKKAYSFENLYDDTFEYNVDNSKLCFEENTIDIIVDYNDSKESIVRTSIYKDKTLLDVETTNALLVATNLNVISNSIERYHNKMSNILLDNEVEVEETDTFDDLIEKFVELLADNKKSLLELKSRLVDLYTIPIHKYKK